MGMYTELHFNAELKKDVPKDVLKILEYMLNGNLTDDSVEDCDLSHPLFSCDRFGFMLRCDSYYFSADSHSTLRYDEISKSHFLCVRTNLKNYDSEIERFIDWIHPYLDEFDGDFLGFYRYEEDSIPTLIFKNRTVRLSQDEIDKGYVVWSRDEDTPGLL